MPINSHVTSEEGKRKLQPKYSNPKKLKKKNLKKKISKKNLSATFQIFKKSLSPTKRVRCGLCPVQDVKKV